MAEGEAIVSGSSDGGEGTGTQMVGGSLPPRKRLLAGLKQNGLCSASSSPESPTAHMSVRRIDEGAGTDSAGQPSTREDLTTVEAEGGCMSCGVVESNAWRKAKHNGVVQPLCEFCNLLFNKNLNCRRCHVLYPDVKDPEGCLECSRCRSVVHVECERRVPQGHEVPYVCVDCVFVKNEKEHVSALLSTGAPPIHLDSDSKAEAGNLASPAAAECSNHCSKKLRMSRESRRKTNDFKEDDVDEFEETCDSTEVLLGRKGLSSKEAAAAAAATAAALAGRAAASARAAAAAKAATAVRAAAIAKAALDAAALAARVEAQVRGDLCRNSVSSQRTRA